MPVCGSRSPSEGHGATIQHVCVVCRREGGTFRRTFNQRMCRNMRPPSVLALARRPTVTLGGWRHASAHISPMRVCAAHVGARTMIRGSSARALRIGALGLAGGVGILAYSMLQWRFLRSSKDAADIGESKGHDVGPTASISTSASAFDETSSSSSPPPPPKSVVSRVWGAISLYVVEPVLVLKRFLVLAITFAPVVLATPLLVIGLSLIHI